MLTHSDEYTRVARNSSKRLGFTVIYGRNICYSPRTRKYIFYLPPHGGMLPLYGAGFDYGWKFRIVRSPVPKESVHWVSEESYVTQPFTEHHIYHFVESINFLWMKQLRRSSFPAVLFLMVVSYLDQATLAAAVHPKSGLFLECRLRPRHVGSPRDERHAEDLLRCAGRDEE